MKDHPLESDQLFIPSSIVRKADINRKGEKPEVHSLCWNRRRKRDEGNFSVATPNYALKAASSTHSCHVSLVIWPDESPPVSSLIQGSSWPPRKSY